jgi:hypothetical protein
MIKKGKEIKMGKTYTNYKVNAGTVDSKNPTSVYINISAWGEPTDENTDSYVSVISSLKKEVKRYIHNNLPLTFSKNRTIIDLDMRESGIAFGKRSFMSCEITLYQRTPDGDILRSTELKKVMGDVTDKLVRDVFDKYESFKFHKKKN